MISIECPDCQQSFSRQRVPKVLPCGHSVCANCIFDALREFGFSQCRACVMNFAGTEFPSPPTNYLFFDMLEKVSKFNMQREWEHGQNNESVPGAVQPLLRIEEQCLYTFCQRRKFERDGVVELYCSQQCKNNHEELQQPL